MANLEWRMNVCSANSRASISAARVYKQSPRPPPAPVPRVRSIAPEPPVRPGRDARQLPNVSTLGKPPQPNPQSRRDG